MGLPRGSVVATEKLPPIYQFFIGAPISRLNPPNKAFADFLSLEGDSLFHGRESQPSAATIASCRPVFEIRIEAPPNW